MQVTWLFSSTHTMLLQTDRLFQLTFLVLQNFQKPFGVFAVAFVHILSISPFLLWTLMGNFHLLATISITDVRILNLTVYILLLPKFL